MVKFSQPITFHNIFLIMLITVTFGVNAHEEPSNEFIHGITIELHHDRYYFAGPPDGINGASDVPGHKWLRVGEYRLLGKHFNTGPFGAPSYWSSDAGDGALLYVMEAIIDKWTEVKALQYYMQGFVHYHTLVNVETGQQHPTKVVWFKHVAVKAFEFDGPGPLAFSGIDAYKVMPGIDYKMAPNWNIPYNPNPTQ